VRLDAYPRLCGLPVTIDRLTAVTETAPVAPVAAAAPSASAAPRRRRRRTLFRRGDQARRRVALTRH
jgi:hypothetical protein